MCPWLFDSANKVALHPLYIVQDLRPVRRSDPFTVSTMAVPEAPPVLLPFWKFTDGTATSRGFTEAAVDELSRMSRAAIDGVMQSVLEVLVLKQPGPDTINGEIAAVLRGEQNAEGVVADSGSVLELSDTDSRVGVEEYMAGIQPAMQTLYQAALDSGPANTAAATSALLKVVAP